MPIELGLLGSGIDRSMAPLLHETLGSLIDTPVHYALYSVEPAELTSMEDTLDSMASDGVRGINVTIPYKEQVAELVSIDDPIVQAMGAVNTVVFTGGNQRGYNTDYSGLAQAFRYNFGGDKPGHVAQLGAGGFGRAAAFAMATLGAHSVRLYDHDAGRAARLAGDVERATGLTVAVAPTAEAAASGATGVVNASPVGSYYNPGCPIRPAALDGIDWVFDAVYTPLRTELLASAEAFGAACLSGSELFFWQGIDCFELFLDTTLPSSVIDTAHEIVQQEVERRSSIGA